MEIALKAHKGFNSEPNCGVCQVEMMLSDGGVYLYDLTTGKPVCGDCAYRDAPVLVGLLNLSIAAEEYFGEGEDESQLPQVFAALKSLCADMEIEERPAEVQILGGLQT